MLQVMARQSQTVRLTITNTSDARGTRSHTKKAPRAMHTQREQLVTRKKAHVLNMEQVYILGLPARLGARLLHATMSSKAFRLKVGV